MQTHTRVVSMRSVNRFLRKDSTDTSHADYTGMGLHDSPGTIPDHRSSRRRLSGNDFELKQKDGTMA